MSDIIELKLKNCLKNFLPILENNFKKSEQDWKNGELSKAVFEYIHQRFVVAHVLLKREDIKGELFFDIYAPLTIDIKSGILLCNEEEQIIRNEELKNWMIYFDEIGFTDRQPVFDYPMKNLNDFDKKNKQEE